MICLNSTTDSSDSAISYSSMSLSSSPVRSSAIQQLLESPIIKSNSQNTDSLENHRSAELDSEPEISGDDILVPESPETTPVGSQETDQQLNGDLPLEVDNSQPMDDQINNNNCETNAQNNCRNSFRRQTSVCVSTVGPFNSSITSSPRALAILKNAIKTGFNSNKISDKTTNTSEEVAKNTNDLISMNGVNSPPSNKLFRNSPLTRGSALLRAAKERIKTQEIERSPKINCNQVLNESNYDRQLTGILRKHELTSSPTSGEPRPKKKKVLFAEPVVSSKLEFKTLPTFGFETIAGLLPRPLVDLEVEELTSKQNRMLVHQNSTFDNEFDSDSQHSSSPLVFRNGSDVTETIIPSCGQPINEDIKTIDDVIEEELQISPITAVDCPDLMAKVSAEADPSNETDITSSQSSESEFMCSQVIPESTSDFDSQECVVIQPEDPIVMVPLRLSQIKELYHLFGGLIEQYSDS